MNHFGYKNHVQTDVKHKFVRRYAITDAAVHDSQVFDELLDESNSSREVFADFAYRTKKSEESLEGKGFRPRLQHKGCKNKPLSEKEIQGNRTRSKIRSRIEHVFGIQSMRAGDLIIRTIGLARAKVKIGLRNLAYNLDRYAAFMQVQRIEAMLEGVKQGEASSKRLPKAQESTSPDFDFKKSQNENKKAALLPMLDSTFDHLLSARGCQHGLSPT